MKLKAKKTLKKDISKSKFFRIPKAALMSKRITSDCSVSLASVVLCISGENSISYSIVILPLFIGEKECKNE